MKEITLCKAETKLPGRAFRPLGQRGKRGAIYSLRNRGGKGGI